MNIKRIKRTLLLLCLITLIQACSNQETPKKLPKKFIQWNTHQEGLAKAIESQKPLFISVHADWCHPCHILEADVFNDSTIAAELMTHFIPIKVDYEADIPLACGGRLKDAKLCLEEDWKTDDSPTALPFMGFYKPNGQKIYSHTGIITPVDFKLLLIDLRP